MSLSVGLNIHVFNLQLRRTNQKIPKAETVKTSHKSLFLSLNSTSVWLMQHSTLLMHSSFVSTHLMCIPGQVWLSWFSQADARPGVFSHSPSLVAVTQEALSFHYPAFPCRCLSQTEVYGNTTAESSSGLSLMNQWNMLQTLYPATPFPGSTLTFAHNSLLSSCKTQRRGLRCSLWVMGM